MNRTMVLTVAAAGLFAGIPRASAISTLYAVDKALNVTLNSQRATATPVGSLGRSNVFELNDGESFKDYSFQIYLVPRGSLSDLLDSKISTTIYFENPATQVREKAVTFQGSFVLGQSDQSKWGQIEWSTPAQTFVEDSSSPASSKFSSRTFTVALSDGLLYPGALGELPSTGSTYLTTVRVNVTQIGSAGGSEVEKTSTTIRSATVPDNGSTSLLLAFSLAVFVLFAKNSVRV